MLSFGSILFSGADNVAQIAWREIPGVAGLFRNGRWQAGTLFEEGEGAENYITFIGTPEVATVGYDGDESFVGRIQEASSALWPKLDPMHYELAFVAFNAGPVPKYGYFEGTEAPRFEGDRVVGTPFDRDWMMHISRAEYFQRRMLRNIFPVNIFRADYLDCLVQSARFSELIKTGWLDVFDLQRGLYGFFVRADQRERLMEIVQAEALVVEDRPLDSKYFVDDPRSPFPTLFPVYDLFANSTRISV